MPTQLKLKLKLQDGLALHTEGVYCDKDILVVPELEDRVVVPTTEKQVITPSDGYAGLRSVEVKAIKSESGILAPKKDINFYDYDGTILYSYSLEEVGSLSALPTLPTHDGLTCQGWNYDLDTIKARTKPLDVGAMYVTDDGNTRLYISLSDSSELTVPLQFKVGSDGSATVDWGDGSTSSSDADTTASLSHTYSEPGDYVISISGTLATLGGDSSNATVMGTWTADGTKVYLNALRKVEIGSNVPTIGQYAFKGCECLETITIPNSVTETGNYAFANCNAIKHASFPNSMTRLGTYVFHYCYALSSVSIPNTLSYIYMYAFAYCSALTRVVIPESVTNIGGNAFVSCYSLNEVVMPDSLSALGLGSYVFGYCYALDSIVIPSGVTKIDTNTFYSTKKLKSMVIPSGVTSIGKYAFQNSTALRNVTIEGEVTTIDNYAFSGCSGLVSLELPGAVTTIGTYAFEKCYSLRVLDFTKNTAVPALSNVNAFSNANANYQVKVPASLYNDWIAAANWSSIADHIVSA